MNSLRLYGRYIATSIRSQRQYPASVIATSIGAFAATITDFVGIWALFARFRRLEGWAFGEVALLYGVVSVSFALADGLTRGFDVFGEQFVKTGDFDRLLVRPRAAVLQLLGYELRITRIGRLAQGMFAWGVGAHLTPVAWSPTSWAILAFAVAGGIALFSGILVLQATLAFWTVESLEVANTLTYGGVEAGQYPLDVYARWFRNFLVYVVPIGCISYFPVSAVLGRVDALPYALTPALGFVFLGAALWIWTLGVRHYTSTGS
jgi:viologen exporter family transport system permease protein